MPHDAKKCTTCDEFQSFFWRLFSSRALTGLVSLLPLLTLIYVFLSERFETNQADLDLVLLQCTQREVQLVGTNLGAHYATINSAHYTVHTNERKPLIFQGEVKNRVFLPNDPRVVTWKANNPGGLAPHDLSNVDGCKVILEFSIYESNNGQKTVPIKCDCPFS